MAADKPYRIQLYYPNDEGGMPFYMNTGHTDDSPQPLIEKAKSGMFAGAKVRVVDSSSLGTGKLAPFPVVWDSEKNDDAEG